MTMKTASNVPEHLRDRAWYNETSAYAFLVHAPITFGHSQLVVSVAPCIHEEDAFSLAAKHMAICIARLRSTFVGLDLEGWSKLAQYSVTSGHYVKTLVLKASANENQGEYKIHLIPCFLSHIEAANALFWARFGKKQTGGGLLYWIGRREDLVDYDTSPLDTVAEERIKTFCLTGLATFLRCPTKPGTT
jgi:hypothetical protein